MPCDRAPAGARLSEDSALAAPRIGGKPGFAPAGDSGMKET